MYSVENKLYNEIVQYFNEDGTIKYTANEDLRDIYESIKEIATNVASIIKKYVPIVLNNVYKITLRITKKYDKLLEMWNNNINKNLRNINEEKYTSLKVKVVNIRELYLRIEFIKDIYTILSDVKRIVNDSSSEWKTVEIDKLLKSSMRVGFDASSFNIAKKLNSVYTDKRKEDNIIDAGYSISKVVETVSRVDSVIKVSRSSFVSKIKKNIEDTANELIARNKIITSSNELNNSSKKNLRNELEVKTIRLWWVSQFVNAYYVLLDDVLSDILVVCSAVEKCIEEN